MAALWLAMTPVGARADQAADIARIHVDAIGGLKRLQALSALSASGHVIAGDAVLAFEMIASRPNRVRVTTRGPGRTVIQGYDGTGTPWRWEPEKTARPQAMPESMAADFVADAEFDDPLVNAEARGFTIDFAGEAEFEGRRVLRLLVTQRDVAPSFLVLDAETYFLLRKETTRRQDLGRDVTVTTVFGDFRPVLGVMLPHRIEVWADGKRLSRTDLELVQPNPGLAPDAVAMPAGTEPKAD